MPFSQWRDRAEQIRLRDGPFDGQIRSTHEPTDLLLKYSIVFDGNLYFDTGEVSEEGERIFAYVGYWKDHIQGKSF